MLSAQLVEQRRPDLQSVLEVAVATVAHRVTRRMQNLRRVVRALVVRDSDVVKAPIEVMLNVPAEKLRLVLCVEQQDDHGPHPNRAATVAAKSPKGRCRKASGRHESALTC